MLCLIALTIVVMIRGSALYWSLPCSPYLLRWRQFTHDMKKMALSVLFSAIFTFTGLLLSYWLDMASFHHRYRRRDIRVGDCRSQTALLQRVAFQKDVAYNQ